MNMTNIWDGFKMFKLYRDGYGNLFEGGARYVCFDGGVLVAEATSATEAELAYKRKERKEGPRLKEYISIPKELR